MEFLTRDTLGLPWKPLFCFKTKICCCSYWAKTSCLRSEPLISFLERGIQSTKSMCGSGLEARIGIIRLGKKIRIREIKGYRRVFDRGNQSGVDSREDTSPCFIYSVNSLGRMRYLLVASYAAVGKLTLKLTLFQCQQGWPTLDQRLWRWPNVGHPCWLICGNCD